MDVLYVRGKPGEDDEPGKVSAIVLCLYVLFTSYIAWSKFALDKDTHARGRIEDGLDCQNHLRGG